MNVFLANKQLQFDVSIKEIETMTPQQAFLFEKKLKETSRELDRIRENGRY